MSQQLAETIGIKYHQDDSITVRGADGNIIDTAGVGEAYLCDPMSTSFRKVRIIITKKGSNFLIGLKDLKNL